MARLYKVSKKGAIMSAGPTNTVLRGGTVITPAVAQQHGLTEKIIQHHLQSGYLVAFNAEMDPEEVLLSTAPGVSVNESLRVKPDQAIETVDKEGGAVVRSGPRDTTPVRIAGTPPAPVADSAAGSKWVLDPATLEGKSLDELNVMVAERDNSIDPLTSIENAVSLLSQDFAAVVTP